MDINLDRFSDGWKSCTNAEPRKTEHSPAWHIRRRTGRDGRSSWTISGSWE